MKTAGSTNSDLAELAPPLQLAIAYAPAAAREPWRGLLALDARLERAALSAREPVLAQIKLAWWRERFATPAGQWPRGEPLLEALRGWEAERPALIALVDGWEGVVGGEPSQADVSSLVEARAQACAGLARLLGQGAHAGATVELGRVWARRDLAERLGMVGTNPLSPPTARLPRSLRPLAVLAEMARPGARGGAARLAGIVRVGLLGR